MRWVFATLWAVLIICSLPESARAQDDVAAFEEQLGQHEAEAASEDCAVACEALGSMARAAEKICELDPGERCEAARRRVDEAKRRVREACPDCSAAHAEAERREKLKKSEDAYGAPADEDQADEADVATAGEAGGCATCTVGHGRDGRPAIVLTLLLAALLSSRRRRLARADRTDRRARSKART